MPKLLALILPLCCGALFALPFVSELSFPIWFALAPVLYIVSAETSGRRAALLASIFSLTWSFTSLSFIERTTVAGMIALCLFTALLYTGGLLLIRVLAQRSTFKAVLGTAAVWGLIELFRARLPVFGFPWMQLGHAVVGYPLLTQIADLFGVYGISFLIALSNAVLAFVLPRNGSKTAFAPPDAEASARKGVGLLLGLLALTFGYGYWRTSTLDPELTSGPTIAVVQGCCYSKLERTDDEKWAQLRHDIKWHERAANPAPPMLKPDLICWAETMVPGIFNKENFSTEFNAAVKKAGVPTIFGTDYVNPDDLNTPLDDQRWYNAAILVDGEAKILEYYGKRRLVPYGEYIPFTETFPIFKKLRSFTRDTYRPGNKPSGAWPIGNFKYGINICIEDAHSDISREAANSGADILINLTNDAWFSNTHLPQTHLKVATLRAVETRRPLLRVTNSGVSALIDPLGRVRQAVRPDQAGVGWVKAKVLKNPAVTPYMAWGDIAPCVVFAGLLLWGLYRRKSVL